VERAPDPDALSTTTNASGIYSLDAPGPGDYRIRVVKANADTYAPTDAGDNDTLDRDVFASGADIGHTAILAVTAASTSIDGGIVRAPISVGNFIWNDRDNDGVQDAGESGPAGVTVQLWNELRNDLIRQTTTSATGIYTLPAPGPGSYGVNACIHCGGTLRIVAGIEQPTAIRAIPARGHPCLAHFAKYGALEPAHYRPGPRAVAA